MLLCQTVQFNRDETNAKYLQTHIVAMPLMIFLYSSFESTWSLFSFTVVASICVVLGTDVGVRVNMCVSSVLYENVLNTGP